MRLEYAPGLDRLAAEHLDRNLIPLLRRCPDQAEEHRAHVGPERPELPVHPPLGVGALPQAFWPHRVRPVPGGEVAHYGVGFPKHEPVIGDRGYQTVRVEREVLGITGEAESAASVDALVLQTQLSAAPSGRLWSSSGPRSSARLGLHRRERTRRHSTMTRTDLFDGRRG